MYYYCWTTFNIRITIVINQRRSIVAVSYPVYFYFFRLIFFFLLSSTIYRSLPSRNAITISCHHHHPLNHHHPAYDTNNTVVIVSYCVTAVMKWASIEGAPQQKPPWRTNKLPFFDVIRSTPSQLDSSFLCVLHICSFQKLSYFVCIWWILVRSQIAALFEVNTKLWHFKEKTYRISISPQTLNEY